MLETPFTLEYYKGRREFLLDALRRMTSPICIPHGLEADIVSEFAGFDVCGCLPHERRECCLGDALARWGCNPVDLAEARLFALNKPLLDLVLLRRWNSLLLRSKLPKAVRIYPEGRSQGDGGDEPQAGHEIPTAWCLSSWAT